MRAPGDEPKLVQAAAAGDPAAVAGLWDAHGARVYALCRRVLADADASADATQDAYLLALGELPRLARSGESFGLELLRAARQTTFELLAARAPASPRGHGLGAASLRLRPQQRAALALADLERLSYAELAAVLGIGAEAVPALLARARLRLHDELHGTALAAAAVRSPDCEDVLPLLAAAADGELDAADATWADPHVLRCPTCARTRRAMVEAAATYAAWSPAAPPSWLRGATLADVGAEASPDASVPVAAGSLPSRRARRRAAGAWATPRPGLSVALLGALLLTAAFAGLLLASGATLHQGDPVGGGARLPDGERSVQVANVPAPRSKRAAARHAPRRARRSHRSAARSPRVSFLPVAAVRRLPARAPSSPLRHRAPKRPQQPAARPKRVRKPRPTPQSPTPAPPAPTAPAPVSADAPADETPATSTAAAAVAPATSTTAAAAPATSTTAAAAAPATPVAATSVPVSAPKTTAPAPTPAPALPLPARHDWHRGDRDGRSHGGPCAPRGRHDR